MTEDKNLSIENRLKELEHKVHSLKHTLISDKFLLGDICERLVKLEVLFDSLVNKNKE